MRLLLQRVLRAEVRVDGAVVGSIGPGLVVLVGVGHDDDESAAATLADKTVDLRVFRDEAGLTNRSLIDAGGEVLAISQFTLFADVRKGRRPSFLGAAPPERGRELYEAYADAVAARGVRARAHLLGHQRTAALDLERVQVDLVSAVGTDTVHAARLGIEATDRGLAAQGAGTSHEVRVLVERLGGSAGPAGPAAAYDTTA
jgi:D-tyrosyl-tRNA(Tyr) deacylase